MVTRSRPFPRLGTGDVRDVSIDTAAIWYRTYILRYYDRRGHEIEELYAKEKADLATRWKDTLAAHQKDAIAHLRKFYASQKGKPAEAFEEGVAAIASGFLWHECWAKEEFRDLLKTWQKDAKKLKLSKKALKDYDAVMPAFDESIGEGWKAFVALNHKHGDVE